MGRMRRIQRMELVSSLEKLLADGRYSDCTIVCGDDNHRVHKAILCMRSSFFETAFRYMKEDEPQILDMQEDDPIAVRMMVNFLYSLDYTVPPEQHQTQEESVSENASKKKREKHPNLLQHARVYALAEKYDVRSLKFLAARKFRRECVQWFNHPQCAVAAREVYSTTPDHDRGLRDTVTVIIWCNRKLLNRKDIQTVMKESLLAFDIVISLYKNRKK
ncbi:hypothetical protein PT974_01394 [Cladobotryum mycophilum]|uniref:BTB domain-containing protein n=1 Tax=Cladobotryum mycophilum TaxID=491253 RepID=A0ABR0T3I1_9HYPO